MNTFQRLKVAEAKLQVAEDGLKEISAMGNVCPEFEICQHAWCRDSVGAKFKADEILELIPQIHWVRKLVPVSSLR